MKTILQRSCLFLACLIWASTIFSQDLSRFEGALKKRETFGKFREKALKSQTETAQFNPVPPTRTCGTMAYDSMIRATNPELGTLDEFEEWLHEKMLNYEEEIVMRGGKANVITIPVIVHVVHNGEPVGQGSNISVAQIMSQIEVLNEDYRRRGPGFNNHPAGADTEIEFAMARVDPDGKPLASPGVNRINGGRGFWEKNSIESMLKPNTIWDPNRYLNMWVVNFGGENANLLGYAMFPSQSGLPGTNLPGALIGQPQNDGVVMGFPYFGRVGNVSAPYNGGRTTTHEVGHWLGLRHIWGDGDCSADDFCADTPNAGSPNFGCTNNNSCNTPSGDMIENYMDYSYDACMNLFTQCQKMRMRTVLQNSPRRKELLSSTVHITEVSNNAPVATFSADRDRICSGETVNFIGSSPNNPHTWFWEFLDEQENVLATFNGREQQITFNAPGIYSVRLTATNNAGSSTRLEKNIVSVLSSFKVVELIENAENLNTAFREWLLFNPDADRTFTLTNVSSYGIGVRSVVFDNFSEDDDPTGTIDALITPSLDFSNNLNPYLYFEYAYAQYSDLYSDTLVLFFSIDCGVSFIPFWYIGGADLATAPPTQNAFIPNSNQWNWNQISLGFLAGQSNVHIAIANFSGWGNNLYLDEISFVDAAEYTTQAPTANFRTATTVICAGDVIQYQDRSIQFPSQWAWQFPGGFPSESGEQHPFVLYNTPGTFSVGQGVANFFGTDTEVKNNYIQVVPLPNISVNADQLPVCGGRPVVLTASGAAFYEWYDQRSGILIHEGPAIEATLYEDWTFTVIGYNQAGCSSQATFLVTISAPPQPTITVQGSSLFSSFAAAYQWYVNGNPIPAGQGGTSQTVQPQIAGLYIVQTFDGAGCSNISLPVQFSPTTSTRDLANISHAIKAYPNPVNGRLSLVFAGTFMKSDFNLEIINMLGTVVHRDVLIHTQSASEYLVDFSELNAGIYTVKLHNNESFASLKIVKQ